MLKFQDIFCFMVLTLSTYLVTARPRDSTQTGEVGACGNRVLHMREPRGTISGANFTGPYSANSSCTWIIMLPQSSKVSLRITSFNVYSNSKHCGGTNCRCDFLQIKEQDSIQNSTGFNEKFCNDFPPKRVYSLMSRVKIRLVSHSLKEGFGFSLSYEATDSSSIDFVPVTAALGSGQAGGARYSDNQTETKAQSKSPRNSNSSGVDVPLSALTSKPPMKLKLSSESSVLPSVAKVSPTTLSRTVTGATKSDKIWTTPVVVVHAVEQKEVEEIVPDIIVLGPSVPVVVIFVLVVMGIAWWNYKFNSEELNRYESYAQTNKSKRHKRHLKSISKGNLYNRMTKDWRGQSINANTRASPMFGRKISFAGKLREGIRTPRPSPAHSEETMLLAKPATATPTFLTPDTAPSGAASRPSSRPASLILRDALLNILSGSETGETSESGSASKRGSKGVSFINEDSGHPLSKQSLPEKELRIPEILVRYPSDDAVNREEIPSEKPTDTEHESSEPEEYCEDESTQLEGTLPKNDTEGSSSCDGRSDSDYPDSNPEEISDRSLIFPDLEDFLLNLDKDSPSDSPPYSCESHVRDILRKSYGEEALSSLGPNTVLDVPDEFLGMVRGSSQSTDKAISDSDRVDDVD